MNINFQKNSILVFTFILMLTIAGIVYASITSSGITLEYPAPAATIWTTTAEFNCSYTWVSGEQPGNVTLWHNLSGTWAINKSNLFGVSSFVNNKVYNITLTNLNDIGSAIWNCRFNGSTTQNFSSSNRTISIDISAPTTFNLLNLTAESNNLTITNDTTPMLNWTATTEANFANYTIQISTNSSSFLNSSYGLVQTGLVTLLVTNQTYNATTLADDTYYWRVIAYEDSASGRGGVYSTQNSSFIVDTGFLYTDILLDTPGNNTWDNDGTVTFNYSVNDNAVLACNLTVLDSSGEFYYTILNDSIAVGTNISNTITSVPDDNFTWSVWCNDTAGNSNTSLSRIFKTDITSPTVTLVTPATGNFSSVASIVFTFNTVDNNTDNGICQLYHNMTGTFEANVTSAYVNGTNTSFSAVVFNESTDYNGTVWNVRCNDSAGNVAYGATNYTITIDSNNPGLSGNSPAHVSWDKDGVVNMSFTAVETNPDSCLFYFGNGTEASWGVNATISTYTNGGKVNLSLPLADGTGYLWNAWCNDSSGRYAWLNSLANFTLKVDTLNVTQPTLGNVLLGSLYYGNDVLGADLTPTVNWTAVTEANFKNYIIQFSDWSNFSHINVTAYTTLAVANNSVTMGTLVDNINYSWRVIAYEDSGEANTSQVYHYKTDSVNSSVNLGIPANNAWSTTAEVNFTWTVTDNNLGGCMLYANFSGTFAANSSLIVGAANATNFSIPNGEYIWNVWCNDTAFPANSAYNSSNRTLKIDTNVPVIVSGINANATVSRIVTFNVTQASGTSVVNQSSIRIGRVTGALNSNFNYTNDCTAITNGYSCSYIETGMLAGATNYLPIDANNTARGAATQYNLSLTMTMAQNLTTRLAAGWNLLSVPFVLSDTSIGDMVANDSKILKMYYYNGTGWRIWNSDGADSLTTLEPRKGYWVNTSAATDLFLYGEYTTGTPAQPYGGLSLPVGWHTIGAYDAGGADGVDTDDALASVCGSSNGGLCSAGDRNWDSLYYYNNATDLLVNVLNTDMTGDNLWNKGSAFWIYMNTADTYI